MSDSREGLPYLQRIPILGNLFSSHNFQKHQTELVIFVTPEIYVPDSDEQIQLPEGWVRDEP
jgi:pilus assembly protein CpaC